MMRDVEKRHKERDLRQKAATLTVTGRYRESLNIMIYLMDRKARGKDLPVVLPNIARRSFKGTKC